MKHREKTMAPAAKVRLTEALNRLVLLAGPTANAAEAERWRKDLAARQAAAKRPRRSRR
jgi:hypothetical protein